MDTRSLPNGQSIFTPWTFILCPMDTQSMPHGHTFFTPWTHNLEFYPLHILIYNGWKYFRKFIVTSLNFKKTLLPSFSKKVAHFFNTVIDFWFLPTIILWKTLDKQRKKCIAKEKRTKYFRARLARVVFTHTFFQYLVPNCLFSYFASQA